MTTKQYHTITLTDLLGETGKERACEKGITYYKATFQEPPSLSACLRQLVDDKRLAWAEWLLKRYTRLLDDEYQAKVQLLGDEYWAKVKLLDDEYGAKVQLLWDDEYDAKVQLLDDEYWAKVKLLWDTIIAALEANVA